MKLPKILIAPGIIALILILGLIYITATKTQDNPKQSNAITNYQDCIDAGNLKMESYPAQCRTKDGQSFTEDIGNELEASSDIRSESPRPNQVVTSPIDIRGQAIGSWYFEASFSAHLLDANGKEVGVTPVTAQGEWMTENFVPYRGSLSYTTPQTKTGTLVLKNANASGLPENDKELRIPITFSAATAKTTVKVFFNNSSMNAQCEKTLPVTREVAQTTAVGKAALEELLKGINAAEIDKGYTTLIGVGVKLNSLSIENGIAKADFSEELENNSGGSCRALGIRSQITETLKQFPTVKEVIISVNGNTESVLQP